MFFLTVDDLDIKPWLGQNRDSVFAGLQASYKTAATLHREAGLDFIVAPMMSSSGAAAIRFSDRYSISLFPFVDGVSGIWGNRISATEHETLIGHLAELHRSTPAVTHQAPNPGLALPGRLDLEIALMELNQPWKGGPFSEPARNELALHADLVRSWLANLDDLVALVVRDDSALVVTHGEPHPGNIMRNGTGLLLVDWDTVGMGHPERDLWMLDDGTGIGLAAYVEATGTSLDDSALSLYRLRWTLADIAAFVTLFRTEHARNSATAKMWRELREALNGVPPAPYSWSQDKPGPSATPRPPLGDRGDRFRPGSHRSRHRQ
jgi:spectinomycin phosphotransferase